MKENLNAIAFKGFTQVTQYAGSARILRAASAARHEADVARRARCENTRAVSDRKSVV